MSRQLPSESQPITAKELVEFREVLFPMKDGNEIHSSTSRQRVLAGYLGVDPSSVHRMENGSTITHGVMIRRALVNIADEMGVRIPNRLRFGEVKARTKRAGAR